jgi:hypothetical protein
MKIAYKSIIYTSRSEHFNIIPLGDIHLGNVGCDIGKLQEIVKYIKEHPRCYWIGLGDYIEAINPIDPRFDPQSIDPCYNIKSLSNLIQTQIHDILSLLKPIRHKCLALCIGNHEETVRLRYYYDIGLELARELKTTLLGYNGFVRLQFIRKSNSQAKPQHIIYTVYCSHGFGNARKSGSKINRIEDVAHYIDADIIILAHEHKKIIAPSILKIGINNVGEVVQKKQIGVMAGSFLRGYVENATTYVEKKGYAPSDLGVVKLILKPDIHDIHCSL